MPKGKIIIDIDEDGTPTIQVQGVKGPRCLAITQELEKALGHAVSRVKTKEYHEREQLPVKQTRPA